MPQVDLDEGEPTTVDRIPWHQGAEDTTGVRVIPRPSPPRPPPRPATRATPPPEPPRSEAIVRWSEPCLVEDVESLSLPLHLREDMLPVGARPEGAAELRIAIVRVVRELGRDYRRHRGRVLRTDAAAIEVAQRHLVDFATEAAAGRMDPRLLATEVARHGALLGEIVARRLGADWVDVSGDHPGLWKMSVPPGTVFTPIGRVHRFIVQRNREQDLVGFFLDLDRASRGRS
jgi:hypothetical protein